jgi:hypothetical protein
VLSAELAALGSAMKRATPTPPMIAAVRIVPRSYQAEREASHVAKLQGRASALPCTPLLRPACMAD